MKRSAQTTEDSLANNANSNASKRLCLERKKNDSSLTTVTQPILSRDVTSLICIRQGDLTAVKSDVIVVCSWSKTLRESVFEAGGDSMKNLFAVEFSRDPAAPIITVAAQGQLAARKVYFLPWQPSLDVTKFQESIGIFIGNAMRKAASENYRSIAFPAIGCGGFGCSISLIAQRIVEEVYHQLVKYPMFVYFIIESDRTNVFDEFQKQIKSVPAIPYIKPVLITNGKATVEVQIGDIRAQNVDVIIGSSSSGILRRAIMNAAGRDVEMAYAKEYENNPNSLIISIPSGQLPCKRIFFLTWRPDANEEVLRQSIVDLVWNVIQNAISYKFTSIALPAIGCGKHGCSVAIIAQTMVKEIKNQLTMRNIPLTVKFVIQPGKQNIYNEFCKQVLSLQGGIETSIDHPLPSTWEQSSERKLRFVVSSNTNEYQSIITSFDQTMKGKYNEIIQIERIQNERWFLQYIAHDREFKKRLNKDTEKRLYHGCSQPVANLIIGDCFNRSFAGVHGTSYGVGVYFSSNADYSHNFTYPNANEERCMFVARVLIGKTTLGNSSVKIRPVGFDSTTNGSHIFVIYHDAQAFAEYLITYK